MVVEATFALLRHILLQFWQEVGLFQAEELADPFLVRSSYMSFLRAAGRVRA